jgi:hypothetical protein
MVEAEKRRHERVVEKQPLRRHYQRDRLQQTRAPLLIPPTEGMAEGFTRLRLMVPAVALRAVGCRPVSGRAG